EDGDEAAARNRIAMDLDDRAIRPYALKGDALADGREALLHLFLDIDVFAESVFAIEKFFGQIEEFAHARIPEHHPLLFVIHRDALIHVLHGRAQLHLGALALGNIAEDRDEAALGHRIARDLDHRAVGPDTLVGELASQRRQALLDLGLDIDHPAELAARTDIAQVFGKSVLAIEELVRHA